MLLRNLAWKAVHSRLGAAALFVWAIGAAVSLPAPAHAQADSPPAGYARCAAEGQVCEFSGGADVVYGARGTWTAPRGFQGGTACNNAVFGDPLYGVVKACYQAPLRQTPTSPAAKWSLSVTVSGLGGVGLSDGSACTASCTRAFDAGSRVVLSARPAPGHRFAGWGGACRGLDFCTVSIDGARQVTATFAAAPAAPGESATLSVAVNGAGVVHSTPSGLECGKGRCATPFRTGSSVTLTAAPSPGSAFTGWGGACGGTAPCTLLLDGSKDVVATFATGTGTGARPVAAFTVENTGGAAQSRVPVTFGQAFAVGDVAAGAALSAVQADGTALPLQMDVKATHGDGSVRHAVLTAVVPTLAAGESRRFTIASAAAGRLESAAPTAQALLGAGFSAAVSVDLGGQAYSASADELLRGGGAAAWLSGPLVSEWLVSAPLKNAAGAAHPHLAARFAVRSYAGQAAARVDVTVENDWAYEPGPQNFTYDARVTVGGATAFSQAGLKHFHHARWRKVFWWGAAQPQFHLRHDAAYLMASKAVPNYDAGVVVGQAALDALAARWAGADKAPMQRGIVLAAMPTTGGRPDIGPLPQWAATYLLSMDGRAKAATLGTGDLAGGWPIHYRDKSTGLPVSLKDFPYMTLLGRPGDAVNPATRKSEAFPACGGDCGTSPVNYDPDSAHQPSLAYLPYLVTGDHFYLEELQFWASFNALRGNPGYREREKGLVQWDQVRGQAWSLRTLGETAYITPDQHPLKAYFTGLVASNLAWYNARFSQANPNALGAIDRTANFDAVVYDTPAGPKTGLAPWQDDFFTWSAGRLAELGFADARPLLAWKAKFPVGRMTAPGYCWIDGATYSLAVRPATAAASFPTFADAYQATMRRRDASGAAVPLVNSKGARYLDQPCGSQAQADWRTQDDLDTKTARGPWRAGEMTGYASEVTGYPSNMQPALAVAADSGAPNAAAAWALFIQRSVKPDYGTGPQWAIVPRK